VFQREDGFELLEHWINNRQVRAAVTVLTCI